MKDRRTIFSPCRKYRYTLWREWDMHNPSYCQFIGLNPSTADEVQDDPTVRRCIDFAKRWGFGALCMTNAFAWRDTDPKKMKRVPFPVAETDGYRDIFYDNSNDYWIGSAARCAGLIVAAWGKDGAHMNRGRDLRFLFGDLSLRICCLGTNKDGTPKHPLYLSASLKPQPYTS